MRTPLRWIFIFWFIHCAFFYLIGTEKIKGIAAKGAFIGMLALGVAFLVSSTIKENASSYDVDENDDS